MNLIQEAIKRYEDNGWTLDPKGIGYSLRMCYGEESRSELDNAPVEMKTAMTEGWEQADTEIKSRKK